jgi:hypothetical protein
MAIEEHILSKKSFLIKLLSVSNLQTQRVTPSLSLTISKKLTTSNSQRETSHSLLANSMGKLSIYLLKSAIWTECLKMLEMIKCNLEILCNNLEETQINNMLKLKNSAKLFSNKIALRSGVLKLMLNLKRSIHLFCLLPL